MRPLTVPQLLNIWDRGAGERPAFRAALLVEATWPDEFGSVPARLAIGERDRRLLDLREWMFGSQLTAIDRCAGCGEQLELLCEVADLRLSRGSIPPEICSVEHAGLRIQFRLPTTLDLVEASANTDEVAVLRKLLFERCLVSMEALPTRADGRNEIIDELVTAVGEKMAELDPQANLHIESACPACGQASRSPFDIATFLWMEIHSWVARLLREVHALASAFGWSEAAILELSPVRRRAYLDLVGL